LKTEQRANRDFNLSRLVTGPTTAGLPAVAAKPVMSSATFVYPADIRCDTFPFLTEEPVPVNPRLPDLKPLG
jgi:hypothetical protein